jgi:hypothetical protein
MSALSQITYRPVIPRPEKIICAVRNYMDHHEEAVAHGMDRQITEFPPIFLRVWRSQVRHNQPVIRPKVSTHLDWEGELAVVIGKSGRPCLHAAANTPVQQLGVLRSSHPAISAFPDMAAGSACTSSFSRLAQRSLVLRPARSHCHRFVTR